MSGVLIKRRNYNRNIIPREDHVKAQGEKTDPYRPQRDVSEKKTTLPTP